MKSTLLFLGFACLVFMIIAAGCTAGQPAQDTVTPVVTPAPVTGSAVNITAAGREYPSFLAVPKGSGQYPPIVLIHSFNGLEQGYREMVERMASDGFVVIAPEWQTYGKQPPDSDVAAIIKGSLAYLSSQPEPDMTRAGLTGFCAGGRYTMLFLPQMKEFRSGVAWYGFPYNGATTDTIPAMHIAELQVPMLMIHGSRDMASPIRNIYNYSTDLDSAGKYFELKVYQGKPHGFMITNGSLSRDDASNNAYQEMNTFFRRTLK